MTISLRAALLASLSIAATPAFAQSTLEPNAVPGTSESETTPDTIIVTGTRATQRTLADSPVPVDVISADQLTQSGFTETNRLLAEQIPSFNFPQPSITDGTDVIRPATLRGLNPDQTLVLINGKRRHTSSLLNINGSVGRGTAAVDINMIPSIALKRVEVLRDGAAAQYGSDAIAGVINFQLRDARDGGQFTATYGQYETRVRGVGEFTGLQLGANGQPVVGPDGTFLINTTGRDRRVSDGETLTVAGTIGLPIGAEGFINLSAEYQNREPTNRTGYDRRRQYNLVGGAVDPREFTFNRLSHRYGDAKTDDMKLFVNAALPLGDAATLYGFGSYGFRDGESAGFYRLANDPRSIASVYPDGFLPLINTEINDYSGVGGLRGEVGGFRYDLSGGYAQNATRFFITNTLNASLGAASPRAFEAGELLYTQTTANLDISRDIELGFAKSFTVSGGLEYRRETFRIGAGSPDSYRSGGVLISANQPGGAALGAAPGAQVFSGFQPVIGGQNVTGTNARSNVSAYLEADLTVSDAFSIQAAGRYEDYTDFGSDVNGKLAARFEPFTGFALRGSIATGFRAPSLQQQFYAAAATNNVNGLLLDTVTLPVGNPVAIALGATPLRPETSISYSAGFVFTAIPRLSLTVDAYQIDIDDRIVVTDNLTASRTNGVPSGTNPGLGIATVLNNAGFGSIAAARFFVNGLDSRTRGIDAVATYRISFDELRVGLTAGINYNETKIRRLLGAPGVLSQVPGIVLFGRQEQGRLTRGQPETKINLGLDVDRDPFGLTLRANRYGEVEATGGVLATGVFNDNFLEAQWVTDLEVRAKPFGDRFELAVGANNLFDTYPTPVPVGLAGVNTATGANAFFPATNYIANFSAYSPNGFNGRFLYGRVSVRF